MAELQEYVPPEWAKHLNHLPKYKLKLANRNTPIHEWNLPDTPAGFSVSIKRDDMTGSTLSGNKIRKLEFLMAEAVARNCKHVISCGSIQSNQCRAVAVCARQLGLQPHLLLRGDIKAVSDIGCEGNLLLDRLCGAQIYITPHKMPLLSQLKPRMLKLAQHIKSTLEEDSYLISVGVPNVVGLFGYITVFEELVQQGVLSNFDDLVLASGTGETAVGLAIANYLTGSKLRVHGIAVSEDARYYHQYCKEILKAFGLNIERSEDILHIIEGHKGQGYGVSSQDQLDFLVKVSSTTGIILDSVYTGKAAKGLVHELHRNPDMFKGNRILFLHTGGVFGLYDGRINNMLKTSGSVTNQLQMWSNIDDVP